MASTQSPSNSGPSRGVGSNAKPQMTKEQEVYQSIEKLAVSGFLGFIVGSIQKFSQISSSARQGSPTPPTSARSNQSNLTSQQKPIPNLPSGTLRPDEVAGQIARRGGMFAALAVIFIGTLESSQIFRDKQDVAAYVTAGSLTGLSVSLFLRAGVKFAAKQTIILGSVCGLYARLQDYRFPGNNTSASTAVTPSPPLSETLEKMKRIITGYFSSAQNPSKVVESKATPPNPDSDSQNSSERKR